MKKEILKKYVACFLVIAMIMSFVPFTAVYAELDNWTLRSPIPTANGLHAVTYGNGTYVAVGASGTILTSVDRATWTTKTSGTTNALSAVTYGNNGYVALGSLGTILTSTDGATWTSRTSGTTNALYAVTYGNNGYVAVGYSGKILTSMDGETWTSRTSESTQNLNAVTYGNNGYVAVGNSGTILTSPDGETWTSKTSGPEYILRGVTYNNGTYVAVGSLGTILTSVNGVTWIEKTSGTTLTLNAVTHDNNGYVVVGNSGKILTSTNGETWTSRTSGTFQHLYAVTYGNNGYVAVGISGTIIEKQAVAGVSDITAVVSPGTTTDSTKAEITETATSKFVVNITDSDVSVPNTTDAAPTTGSNLIDGYISGANVTTGAAVGVYLQIYDVDANGKVAGFYQKQLTTDDINQGTLTYWQDNIGTVTGFTGSGTETEPYQISSAEELAFLAQRVNAGDSNYNAKYYELTQNIDLADHQWTPIGLFYGDFSRTFNGHFDGKGYEISNVNIGTEASPDSTYDYVGLFGYTGGTIQNVGVSVNVYSSKAGKYAGGLTGQNNGTINNSYVTGTVTGGVGGSIGGLAGANVGTINNSYATGRVAGDFEAIGGLIGHNLSSGTITNGYYNSEQVSAGIGMDDNSQTVTAKTTSEMQSQAFVNTLNTNATGHSNWTAWKFVAGNYPTLYDGSQPPATTSAAAITVIISPGTATGSTKADITETATSKFVVDITDSEVATPNTTDATPTTGSNLIDGYISGANITSGAAVGVYLQVYDVDANGKVAGFYQKQLTTDDIKQVTLTYWQDNIGSVESLTGWGNQTNPYKIRSAEELAFMAKTINSSDDIYDEAYFELTQDIDLSGHQWTPIGVNNAFKGRFDGKGYDITNVLIGTVEHPDQTNQMVGLFASLGSEGVIENLGVSMSVSTSTTMKVGGLVADNYGRINNCYSTGELIGDSANYIGGLVGFNNSTGEVINSYALGEVTSKNDGNRTNGVGGLVGFTDGSLSNSYVTGNVTGSKSYVGGLAGGSGSNATINNSYATGEVTGGSGSFVGGLVGFGFGTINSSYYNSDATQTKNGTIQTAKGVGIGTDTADGIPESTMKASSQEIEGALVDKLNNKIGANTNWYSWKQDKNINSAYPTHIIPNMTVDAEAPTISTQPTGATLNVGATAELTIAASVNDGGTLSYQWYSNTINSNSGGSIISGATSASYDAPTAAEGTTYYYVEVTNTNNSATGNTTATVTSGVVGVTVNTLTNAEAPTISTQPTGATVNVGATAELTIAASVNDGGTLSYQWYSNTINSISGGSIINGATSASYNAPTAAEGTTYYYVEVTNTNNSATGNTRATVTSNISPVTAYVAPRDGGESNSRQTPQPTQEAVIIIVNGEKQNAGKETKTTEAGKSTVTVEVDNKAIESKIDEAIKANKTETGNVIQVPIADIESEIAKVELTGDIVKKLEENSFDVSVKRDDVEYIIPAEEFTISNVAQNLGVEETDFKDIKVEIKITKLDETVVEKYNEAVKANGAELVFPPVAFEVVAKTTKSDGSTGEVGINKFSNYVERIMEIPAGIDPSKITTGIVFNLDGTYSHVPTEVFQKDGKWYAKLNSLTNSSYSVIWNPITVKAVEKHWSKDAVNNMASRLVVFNPEKFEPNEAITRADFAEYIVRALGLYREGAEHVNKFSDVSANGDRTLAILIANEYGLVTGYPDGTFRPDAPITREEAMTMYQGAMKITKLVGTDVNRYQNYTDYKQVGSWATAYVKEVLSAHVFNGASATTISPKSNLTYAEAAQAIKNLLMESKLINK